MYFSSDFSALGMPLSLSINDTLTVKGHDPHCPHSGESQAARAFLVHTRGIHHVLKHHLSETSGDQATTRIANFPTRFFMSLRKEEFLC